MHYHCAKWYLTRIFNYSLIKEETQRPKYNRLLEHGFIKRSETEKVDVAAYVCSVLDDMANNGIAAFTTDQPWFLF